MGRKLYKLLMSLQLILPRIQSPLDEDFRPAILANRNFQREVGPVGARLILGLERFANEFSRFEVKVYPEGHQNFDTSLQYVERIVKFLLWQRGGHTLYAGIYVDNCTILASHFRGISQGEFGETKSMFLHICGKWMCL